MRADKAKSLSKVAVSVLKDPLQTQQEIAESTGLSIWNVNDKLKEIEKQGWKDPRIIKITDKDLDNVETMQAIIAEKLKDKSILNDTKITELAQVMKEATSRYTIFRGTATDDQWGLKNIDSIDIL